MKTKNFQNKGNGYNSDEVDEFLDELMISYEKLYKESTETKEIIEKLNGELDHYKAIETTLQNTLIVAQTTADEVKEVAKKQSEQIIAEAKVSAEKEVAALDSELALRRKELAELEKQFEVYKAKMESLLISQLELLKDVNRN